VAEKKSSSRRTSTSRSSSSKGTGSRSTGRTSRSGGTRRETASRASAEEAEEVEEEEEAKADPLESQGYGEEDFSGRDYTIPGVDPDDHDPYKWHTGKKRDHGGEDAIEIIDLVKQFGRARILNGCNLGLPDNMISMVL
jgi:hypothetical protein